MDSQEAPPPPEQVVDEYNRAQRYVELKQEELEKPVARREALKAQEGLGWYMPGNGTRLMVNDEIRPIEQKVNDAKESRDKILSQASTKEVRGAAYGEALKVEELTDIYNDTIRTINSELGLALENKSPSAVADMLLNTSYKFHSRDRKEVDLVQEVGLVPQTAIALALRDALAPQRSQKAEVSGDWNETFDASGRIPSPALFKIDQPSDSAAAFLRVESRSVYGRTPEIESKFPRYLKLTDGLVKMLETAGGPVVLDAIVNDSFAGVFSDSRAYGAPLMHPSRDDAIRFSYSIVGPNQATQTPLAQVA